MFKIIFLILINLSKNTNDIIFDGIYNIMNIYYNLNLVIKNNKILLNWKHRANFRITNIKDDSYYITSAFRYLKLGFNNEDEIILDNNKDASNLKFQWNIIKIGNKQQVIIQNKYNNKILEVCNDNLKLSENNNLINNGSLFKFYKLFEEYKYQYRYLKYTLKEPIDIIIKYHSIRNNKLYIALLFLGLSLGINTSK